MKTKLIRLNSHHTVTLYPENQDLASSVREQHLYDEEGLLLPMVNAWEHRKTKLKSAIAFVDDTAAAVCIIDQHHAVQIFVKEEHRRQGLGSTLLAELRNTLRRNRSHLHAFHGLNPSLSGPFWEATRIMVEDHAGLGMSQKELQDLMNGVTTVEIIRTKRRLEYHLAKGWITPEEYNDQVNAMAK